MHVKNTSILIATLLTSISPSLLLNETSCGFWPLKIRLLNFVDVLASLSPMTRTKNNARGRRIRMVESLGRALIFCSVVKSSRILILSLRFAVLSLPSTFHEVMGCICATRGFFNDECSGPPPHWRVLFATRARPPLSKQEIPISRDRINEPRRRNRGECKRY